MSQSIGYARVSGEDQLATVHPIRLDRTTGADALAALERALSPGRCSLSPRTVRKYLPRARAYLEWPGLAAYPDAFLDAVGAQAAVKAWQRYQLGELDPPLSPSYVNIGLAAVALMYKQIGITIKVKASRVPKPDAPKSLTRSEESYLRRTAERRVVDGRPQAVRDRAIIEFLLGTGARVEECARVRVEHLDLTERTGTVRLFGKGDQVRQARVDKLARSAVQALLAEQPGRRGKLWLGRRGPLTVEGITAVVGAIGREAKLPGLHPHRLRHTAATRWREEGVDIAQIQAQLGHALIETTARYFRASADELQAAIDRRWAVDEA